MTNAFTIDPATRTIEAVEHDLEDYKDIYRHIGADCFDAVRIVLIAGGTTPVECTVWVDDEGALKEDHKAFLIGYRREVEALLAGKALITGGAGPEGETLPCDPRLTFEDVQAQVRWTESQVTPGFIIRDMATGRIL